MHKKDYKHILARGCEERYWQSVFHRKCIGRDAQVLPQKGCKKSDSMRKNISGVESHPWETSINLNPAVRFMRLPKHVQNNAWHGDRVCSGYSWLFHQPAKPVLLNFKALVASLKNRCALISCWGTWSSLGDFLFSSTAAKASNGIMWCPKTCQMRKELHIAKEQRIGITESCIVLAVGAALPSEALVFPRALFGELCAIVRAFRIAALFVCPCQIGELLQIVYRISSMRTCILTCLGWDRVQLKCIQFMLCSCGLVLLCWLQIGWLHDLELQSARLSKLTGKKHTLLTYI